jgi:hypothetical protein
MKNKKSKTERFKTFSNSKKALDIFKELNSEDLESAYQMFKENKVQCVKYNHSVESSIQLHETFSAYIQISPDHQDLIIMNKRPLDYRKLSENSRLGYTFK